MGMNLRQIPWPTNRIILFLLSGVMAVLLIGVSCAFLHISHPRDIEAFLGMASECHPVWRQFALRKFGPGDSAQRFLSQFPPTRRVEFGRYGVYSYGTGSNSLLSFTSLSVVTRDGNLISARSGSCTWQFTFFSTADPEFDRQYAVFMQERHHEAEQNRLQRLEGDLQRFYAQDNRWPTNEAEFTCFVTGETPQKADRDNSFAARYGLVRAHPTYLSSLSANPLGITLKYLDDGALTIGLNGEPDSVGVVAKPSK
jgi:hypothetical protein